MPWAIFDRGYYSEKHYGPFATLEEARAWHDAHWQEADFDDEQQFVELRDPAKTPAKVPA